jgi:PAS domain-containing protein
MPAVPSFAEPLPAPLLARFAAQQRHLLRTAAAIVAAYYVAFFTIGLYPFPAFLVGLAIPGLFAAASIRLQRGGPGERQAWLLAVAVGASCLSVATAALSERTACVGFHVIWALPLVYTLLLPYALAPCVAGAVASIAGGLLLMLWDDHPAAQVVQWLVVAVGGAAFAVLRVTLSLGDQRAGLEYERATNARAAFNERRYRLLADNAQDVIWTLDLASRRLSYLSPSVARLTGYTAEEALALPLQRLLTPAALARAAGALERTGAPAPEGPYTRSSTWRSPPRWCATRPAATWRRPGSPATSPPVSRPRRASGAARRASGR